MLLFADAFTNYSTLELITFIIGIVAIIAAIAFIFLSFKEIAGKVFKLFSHIILPVIAITFLFALMFMRLNIFSDILSFVVGFGIAVGCELIAFGVALLICRKSLRDE